MYFELKTSLGCFLFEVLTFGVSATSAHFTVVSYLGPILGVISVQTGHQGDCWSMKLTVHF